MSINIKELANSSHQTTRIETEEQKWEQLLNDIKKTYLSLGGKTKYFNEYSDTIITFLKERVTPI